MKMFISGSISSKEIPDDVVKSVDESRRKNYTILVGDARGIDKNIQDMLKADNYKNVEVYHVGPSPRNFSDREWVDKRIPVDIEDEKLFKNGKYTREAQMLKDKAMSDDADFGLVIWKDTSKNRFGNISVSKGSLNNIYNLLVQNKYVGLFYIPNPEKGIMKFNDVVEFEERVIEKLVQKETKDYYYNMKKNASNSKAEKIIPESSNTEQLSLFS
ncbi:hypothetical protein [Streptococcus anginosus]|uniref:Uncharacterized conserved small protein n=1 Tax=Streptococcus anginosus TaxID=1328 RepID=A0A448AJ94_STRAP|nr:hypothetical protein [Streptococcus anginosus]GAD41079.1 hypothetical protein ANG3_1542 [Streptococcus intermedius SK54 = ATCC 27335]MBZ2158324.1 hypothetical protein [Streptococcus anginosus]ORE81271.1 hypothetical protein B6C93_08695 [Streptococcus anginosus SK52 = DSM 20563]UEB01602.1 hypothetical protein LK450_06565 [Streptococcus anginosus subsp. anginosus]VED98479.1 Uncharacterized conserved small protein [Streptococcus anginosus]